MFPPFFISISKCHIHLTQDEVHLIVHKHFHLFPELLLHIFLGMAAQVRGRLTHASQGQRVALCCHLAGKVARSFVDGRTLEVKITLS